jgi:hypothetical protein
VSRAVRGGRWRQVQHVGANIGTLAGAWFVASGAIELFVSGMETSQRLWRAPSDVSFAMWRGRADTVLLLVTIAIALSALVYLALWRLAPHTGQHDPAGSAAKGRNESV